jgi:hypothetical protein
MNFPASRFSQEVTLLRPNEWTPVLISTYKVTGDPGCKDNRPSYNNIQLENGPWGAWSVVEVKPGMQQLNGERCDQLKDFAIQIPQWTTDQMGADWINQILEQSNDPDNSFGIYMRYGNGCY